MSDEGKKHSIMETIKAAIDAGAELPPRPDYVYSDRVEWVLVHKRCGKYVTGSSTIRVTECICRMDTDMPPDVNQIMGWCVADCVAYAEGYKAAKAEAGVPVPADIKPLLEKCEAAEKRVVELTEKLDKASRKIAELVKKEKP